MIIDRVVRLSGVTTLNVNRAPLMRRTRDRTDGSSFSIAVAATPFFTGIATLAITTGALLAVPTRRPGTVSDTRTVPSTGDVIRTAMPVAVSDRTVVREGAATMGRAPTPGLGVGLLPGAVGVGVGFDAGAGLGVGDGVGLEVPGTGAVGTEKPPRSGIFPVGEITTEAEGMVQSSPLPVGIDATETPWESCQAKRVPSAEIDAGDWAIPDAGSQQSVTPSGG